MGPSKVPVITPVSRESPQDETFYLPSGVSPPISLSPKLSKPPIQRRDTPASFSRASQCFMALVASSAMNSSVYLENVSRRTRQSHFSLHGAEHASQITRAPGLIEEVVLLENHDTGSCFCYLVSCSQPDWTTADNNHIVDLGICHCEL
ncbi:unnamed protein product [Fusarium graminearum]|nr:unnamed protein product [Fusarium graminearum]